MVLYYRFQAFKILGIDVLQCVTAIPKGPCACTTYKLIGLQRDSGRGAKVYNAI